MHRFFPYCWQKIIILIIVIIATCFLPSSSFHIGVANTNRIRQTTLVRTYDEERRQRSCCTNQSSMKLFAENDNAENRVRLSTFQSKSSSPKAGAQFEYQEMKILFNAMKEQKVTIRDLNSSSKRTEITNYVRAIVNNRQSDPVVFSSSTFQSGLPGTVWRLAYSTESTIVNDLPHDTTVYLKFLSSDTMEYTLQFSEKTFGINRITARCPWYTNDSNNYNEKNADKNTNPGLITFVYDKITADMFGMKDMNVGFFGLLQGRGNSIDTAFYDGAVWIEQSVDQQGKLFVNVYIKEEESS